MSRVIHVEVARRTGIFGTPEGFHVCWGTNSASGLCPISVSCRFELRSNKWDFCGGFCMTSRAHVFICVAPEPLGSERKRHVITSIACPCLMSMTNVMSISHVHEWPLCHNACRSRKRARACVWVATGADARDCATFPRKNPRWPS